MKELIIKFTVLSAVLFVLSTISVQVISAQGTDFSYQGNLTDGGHAANGSFEFEFRLYDSVSGGNQQGGTVSLTNIDVTGGNFSVILDFGQQFSGASRFLDIRVRPAGSVTYTALSPRSPIKSAPYANRSRNATLADFATNASQLGGVNSNQYVLTTDFRLTNSRNPLPGSDDYIRNSTSAQPTSNLNISGTGEAEIFRANTQFNIAGSRVLSIQGTSNAFIGPGTGTNNTTGRDNSFAGSSSGFSNQTGSRNSLFGTSAGRQNTTGDQNTFFGMESGYFNTTGDGNTFVGHRAGRANISGANNVLIGNISGSTTTTGSDLTLIGALTTTGSGNLNFATAIGAGAQVNLSNTMVLGRGADNVSIPGIATIGNNTTRYGHLSINAPNTNANFYMSGDGAFKGINFGVDSTTNGEAKLFISQYDGVTYLDRITVNENGEIGINVLGQGGSTSLCRNSLNYISTCSSSARYKSDIEDFRPGLSLIRKLRPVSFRWRDNGMPDIGLVAEEVAETEPLLTTTVDGITEGVKYDRIGVVLVNAVQEQQTQIDEERRISNGLREEVARLNERLTRQESELRDLKRKQEVLEQLKILVCSTNKSAEICN